MNEGQVIDREQFLKENKLSDVLAIFQKRDISIEELLDFDDDDLVAFATDLGLDPLQKNRFKKAINKLRPNKNQNNNNINNPPINTLGFSTNTNIINTSQQSEANPNIINQNNPNQSHVIVSPEEHNAISKLYERYNDTSKLIENLKNSFEVLENASNDCKKSVNDGFDDLIKNLENKKIDLMKDAKEIKNVKKEKLLKQLSDLKEYCNQINEGRKKYEEYICDPMMDINKRKTIILNMINTIITNSNQSLVMVTQPKLSFNVDEKIINQFLDNLIIDDCDQPFPPLVRIKKIEHDRVYILFNLDNKYINSNTKQIIMFDVQWCKISKKSSILGGDGSEEKGVVLSEDQKIIKKKTKQKNKKADKDSKKKKKKKDDSEESDSDEEDESEDEDDEDDEDDEEDDSDEEDESDDSDDSDKHSKKSKRSKKSKKEKNKKEKKEKKEKKASKKHSSEEDEEDEEEADGDINMTGSTLIKAKPKRREILSKYVPSSSLKEAPKEQKKKELKKSKKKKKKKDDSDESTESSEDSEENETSESEDSSEEESGSQSESESDSDSDSDMDSEEEQKKGSKTSSKKKKKKHNKKKDKKKSKKYDIEYQKKLALENIKVLTDWKEENNQKWISEEIHIKQSKSKEEVFKTKYKYTVSDLKDNQSYAIRVRGNNSSGWGDYSKPILVTTIKLSIDSKILKSKEIGYFIKILPKELRKKRFKLIFRGSKDGFMSSQFHTVCDNRGPTVVFVESTMNHVFGGYTSVAWSQHSNTYVFDQKAFIFLLRSSRGSAPQKWNITNTSNAVYHSTSYGPTFGGGFDFYLCNNCNSVNSSYANLGHSYAAPKDRNLLAGSYNFTVKDFEVFQVK